MGFKTVRKINILRIVNIRSIEGMEPAGRGGGRKNGRDSPY